MFSFFVNHIGYCQVEPVELTIKPDKEAYGVGDKIILEATFKNNSEKDIIIYWSRGMPNVQRTVSQGSGSVIVYTSESLFPEVKKIYMGYKESVTKTIKIPTVSWPPLLYQLKLQYIPPNIDLNLIISPNQEILVHPVNSNTVTIKVTDSKPFKGY